MSNTLRTAVVALVTFAFAAPAGAQPSDKPVPEPVPMGVAYYYQPGNPYWYAPAVPTYTTAGYVWTYYPYRPAVVLVGAQPVATSVPAAPVAVGPTWTMAPVAFPYPFASSGPVYGRYSWDYSGYLANGYGWYSTNLPHYPYSYQYPTLAGRVWMGYGW